MLPLYDKTCSMAVEEVVAICSSVVLLLRVSRLLVSKTPIVLYNVNVEEVKLVDKKDSGNIHKKIEAYFLPSFALHPTQSSFSGEEQQVACL